MGKAKLYPVPDLDPLSGRIDPWVGDLGIPEYDPLLIYSDIKDPDKANQNLQGRIPERLNEVIEQQIGPRHKGHLYINRSAYTVDSAYHNSWRVAYVTRDQSLLDHLKYLQHLEKVRQMEEKHKEQSGRATTIKRHVDDMVARKHPDTLERYLNEQEELLKVTDKDFQKEIWSAIMDGRSRHANLLKENSSE